MNLIGRRLNALVLTAVLLIGGSGGSAFDLAVYHLGNAGPDAAAHRVGGADAPRPHGDTCVLLDWTARGPYSPALSVIPPRPAAPEIDRALPAPASEPRLALLFSASRPRAPPVPLA